jgi:16S rRNA (cytidine1402-2'-O)-methyltransferase
MGTPGSFILFPCPISEGKTESLSSEAIQLLHATTHFIVERAKTARHFIKSTQHPIPLPQLEILEISDDKKEMEEFMDKVISGVNIGIISEAGCPGIADPGAEIVAWAHQHDVRVIPLVGPSSILMALMASGFSGQNFAFNGYLSNKKPELIQQLKSLETKVRNTGQTQIFMETPYRNGFMIECCVQTLEPTTHLCIACDINGPTEDIKQMTIKKWRSATKADYHKRPCIYVLG